MLTALRIDINKAYDKGDMPSYAYLLGRLDALEGMEFEPEYAWQVKGHEQSYRDGYNSAQATG